MVFLGKIMPETIGRDQDHIGLLLLRGVIGPAGHNDLYGVGRGLGKPGKTK
jgi:hypothetical protein